MVFKLTIGEVCKHLFYLIDWRDVDKLSVIISKVYELFSIFFFVGISTSRRQLLVSYFGLFDGTIGRIYIV
jgi:hypothetical protein